MKTKAKYAIGDVVEVVANNSADSHTHNKYIGKITKVTYSPWPHTKENAIKCGDYWYDIDKKDWSFWEKDLKARMTGIIKSTPTSASMNRKQFRADLEDTYQKALLIFDSKNADYATESDPFLNFNNTAFAGVTVEQAILVRITDKLTRIGNLQNRTAAVKDETVEDTIMDAINYLAILLAYRHSLK